jgi:hypothetical protein
LLGFSEEHAVDRGHVNAFAHAASVGQDRPSRGLELAQNIAADSSRQFRGDVKVFCFWPQLVQSILLIAEPLRSGDARMECERMRDAALFEDALERDACSNSTGIDLVQIAPVQIQYPVLFDQLGNS